MKFITNVSMGLNGKNDGQIENPKKKSPKNTGLAAKNRDGQSKESKHNFVFIYERTFTEFPQDYLRWELAARQ